MSSFIVCLRSLDEVKRDSMKNSHQGIGCVFYLLHNLHHLKMVLVMSIILVRKHAREASGVAPIVVRFLFVNVVDPKFHGHGWRG